MSDTLVIKQFRLRKDKPNAEWLKADEQIDEWIKQQPGFLFRCLSETTEGEWFVVEYWSSMEAVKAAEEKFRETLEGLIAPFIEISGFTVRHSKAHAMRQNCLSYPEQNIICFIDS
ncbi:antibiotic biosynthesis monooxygenase [mine drainage metagenome]|uniref:Antibiotic biosynthesis monooxygenase n=1 Tax=mine drainage metagenome TaxID=410659 RepID=A0A1J5ST78_9ZZZZ